MENFMSEQQTITATLSTDERFRFFFEALTKTGLNAVLSGPGPFTACAPTNEAFRRLSPIAFDAVMQDPEGQMTRVLQYHILFGMLVQRDLNKLNFPKTRLGTTVEINERAGVVVINAAKVIIPDILCSNGVIHGIDAVLIPK
jgi:transforming growth factor-beta-induced protein